MRFFSRHFTRRCVTLLLFFKTVMLLNSRHVPNPTTVPLNFLFLTLRFPAVVCTLSPSLNLYFIFGVGVTAFAFILGLGLLLFAGVAVFIVITGAFFAAILGGVLLLFVEVVVFIETAGVFFTAFTSFLFTFFEFLFSFCFIFFLFWFLLLLLFIYTDLISEGEICCCFLLFVCASVLYNGLKIF